MFKGLFGKKKKAEIKEVNPNKKSEKQLEEKPRLKLTTGYYDASEFESEFENEFENECDCECNDHDCFFDEVCDECDCHDEEW